MYYIYFCNLYKAEALPLSTWGICDLVFRCVSLGADAKTVYWKASITKC